MLVAAHGKTTCIVPYLAAQYEFFLTRCYSENCLVPILKMMPNMNQWWNIKWSASINGDIVMPRINGDIVIDPKEVESLLLVKLDMCWVSPFDRPMAISDQMGQPAFHAYSFCYESIHPSILLSMLSHAFLHPFLHLHWHLLSLQKGLVFIPIWGSSHV